MTRRVLALAVLPAAIGLPLTACGGSSGGDENADPAKAVPAGAAVYVQAVVRPDGSLRSDTEAALRKVLSTDDPAARARQLFDRAAKSEHLTYDRDVAPWLGRRIGLFFTSFAGGHPEGAVIMATKDPDKARTTLEKDLRNTSGGHPAKVTKRTYRGVSYSYESTDKDAAGIVGAYAVVGSDSGLRQVIDTTKGAAAISAARDFGRARRAANGDNAPVLAYADPQVLLDAIAKATHLGAGEAALRQAAAQAGSAFGLSVGGDANALRLDAAALGAPAPTGASGAAADAVAGLPADAWLAAGLGDLGAGGRKALDQIKGIGSFGGVDVTRALARFRAQTGLDVSRDLLSWMGPGALYARGQGLGDLGAALRITSRNPARSRAAVGKIGTALRRAGLAVSSTRIRGYEKAIEVRAPRLPIPFYVAAGGDVFSLGVNADALADVVKPSQRLGDSTAYKGAAKLLGSGIRPSFVLDLPTVVRLLEGFGLGNRPEFARVKRYLDAIGAIGAGASRQGDVTHSRLVVGLR